MSAVKVLICVGDWVPDKTIGGRCDITVLNKKQRTKF
jgi:hypothetical protein